MARHQVPAAEHGLGLGPVVDESHHHAEPAGDLVHLQNVLDEVVGGADDARGGVGVGVEVDGLRRRRQRLQPRPLQRRDVVVVVPAQQPVLDVTPSLVAGERHVEVEHHPPVGPVHDPVMLGGGLLGEAPLQRQRRQALGGHRTDRQHAHAVLAGERHARRADHRRRHHRDLVLVRQDLQLRVVQREPVALVGEALAACEQALDDRDGLVLAVPQQHRVDAQRVGVRRQCAGPGAEHRPPEAHLVELDDALGDHERMVIGDRGHPGAQLDAAGAHRRSSQEHLGRADRLPSGRVMLTAPELVVPQPVEVGDQVEIPLQLQRRALPRQMMRCQKRCELHRRDPTQHAAPNGLSGAS